MEEELMKDLSDNQRQLLSRRAAEVRARRKAQKEAESREADRLDFFAREGFNWGLSHGQLDGMEKLAAFRNANGEPDTAFDQRTKSTERSAEKTLLEIMGLDDGFWHTVRLRRVPGVEFTTAEIAAFAKGVLGAYERILKEAEDDA